MPEASSTKPERLLLYAHFDPEGIVDSHVFYQIRALHDFGMNIIFISNSPLTEEDRKLLEPLTVEIRERPDEGYDWAAWKECLLDLGEKKAGEYDELVIMNDSTFGPLFPLDEMFSAMDETGVDFWGISRDNHPYYGEHLQPYFCVFQKRLFSSSAFWNFWRTLTKIKSFNDAINLGELAMTRILNEAGFIHAAYAELFFPAYAPAIGPGKPLAYTAVPALIRERRAPFVKIKAFCTWPGKQYNSGSDVFQALDESGSLYPQKYIYNHLRRTRPLSWRKNLPGFLKMFPHAGEILPNPHLKIAVFAHLFYEDQFTEAIAWLSRMPYAFDLYVSTSSEEKKAALESQLKRNKELKASRSEIRVFEDRGRDVAPWLSGFNDVQLNYEIALKFHLKKRITLNSVFSHKWHSFLLASTLASPCYISHVLALFKQSSDMGVAFNPIPPAFLLQMHGYSGDATDRAAFDNALNACGIGTPVETSFPIFPQNIFWYRPKALKRLFASGLTAKDFPPEPFPANGTLAHGIERAIPYIANEDGFDICQIIPDQLLLASYQELEDHLWHLAENEKTPKEQEASPWKVYSSNIYGN